MQTIVTECKIYVKSENKHTREYQDLLHMPGPEAQVLNLKIAWIDGTGLRMPGQ